MQNHSKTWRGVYSVQLMLLITLFNISGPRFTFHSSFAMFDDSDSDEATTRPSPQSFKPANKKKSESARNKKRSQSYSFSERPNWNNAWNEDTPSARGTPDYMADINDMFTDGFQDSFDDFDKLFGNMFHDNFFKCGDFDFPLFNITRAQTKNKADGIGEYIYIGPLIRFYDLCNPF